MGTTRQRWRDSLPHEPAMDYECIALDAAASGAVAAARGAAVHVFRLGGHTEGSDDTARQQQRLPHRGRVVQVRWGGGGFDEALLTLDGRGTARLWVAAPDVQWSDARAAGADVDTSAQPMCLASTTPALRRGGVCDRLVAVEWLLEAARCGTGGERSAAIAGISAAGDVHVWAVAWCGSAAEGGGAGAWRAPALVSACVVRDALDPLADARAWHVAGVPGDLTISRFDAERETLSVCMLRDDGSGGSSAAEMEGRASSSAVLCGHGREVISTDVMYADPGGGGSTTGSVTAVTIDEGGGLRLWALAQDALVPHPASAGSALRTPAGCTHALLLQAAVGTQAVACVREGGLDVLVAGRGVVKSFDLAEHAPLVAATSADVADANGQRTRWIVMLGKGGESLIASRVVLAGSSCALMPPITATVESDSGTCLSVSCFDEAGDVAAIVCVGTRAGNVRTWALGKGPGGGPRLQFLPLSSFPCATRAEDPIRALAIDCACGTLATVSGDCDKITLWDGCSLSGGGDEGYSRGAATRIGEARVGTRVWNMTFAEVGGQRVLLAATGGGVTTLAPDTRAGSPMAWAALGRAECGASTSGRAVVAAVPAPALRCGVLAVICGGPAVAALSSTTVASGVWPCAGPVPIYHPRAVGERLAVGDKATARAVLRRLAQWLRDGGERERPFEPMPLAQLLDASEQSAIGGAVGGSSGHGWPSSSNGSASAAVVDPMASGMLDPSMFGFGGGGLGATQTSASRSGEPSKPSPFSMGVSSFSSEIASGSSPAPASASGRFGAREAEELAELVSTTAQLPRVSPSERVELLHLIDELAAEEGTAAQRGALDYYADRAWLGGTTVTGSAAKTRNGGASDSSSSGVGAFGAAGGAPGADRGRHMVFSWTSMAWACFSDTPEALLDACMTQGAPLLWSRAAALGAGWWLARGGRGALVARAVAERIARAEFSATRKAEDVALWYLALGRRNVLLGLYRSCSDTKLVGFLSRDFEEEKNRVAAAKNAYALLGQHRFRLAAAFFLLACNLKEAVSVLKQKEPDGQLAAMIAAIVEGADGDVSKGLMRAEIESAERRAAEADESQQAGGVSAEQHRQSCAWNLCVLHACAGDSNAAAAALASRGRMDARAFDMVDAMARRLGHSNRGSLISNKGLEALAAGAAHTLEGLGLPLAALRRLHAVSGSSDSAGGGVRESSRAAVMGRLSKLCACWSATGGAGHDEGVGNPDDGGCVNDALRALARHFGDSVVCARGEAQREHLASLHSKRAAVRVEAPGRFGGAEGDGGQRQDEQRDAADEHAVGAIADALGGTLSFSRFSDPVEVFRVPGEHLLGVSVRNGPSDEPSSCHFAVVTHRRGVVEGIVRESVLGTPPATAHHAESPLLLASASAFPPYASRWMMPAVAIQGSDAPGGVPLSAEAAASASRGYTAGSEQASGIPARQAHAAAGSSGSPMTTSSPGANPMTSPPASPMVAAAGATSPWSLGLEPIATRTPTLMHADDVLDSPLRSALADVRREDAPVTCAASHPTQPLFVTGTSAGQALLWGFGTEAPLAAYGEGGSSFSVCDVAFDDNGTHFAAGDNGGVLSLWRLDCGGRGLHGARDFRRCFQHRACGVTWLQGSSGVSARSSVVAAAGVGAAAHEDVVVWDSLLPPRASVVASARVNSDGAGARCLCAGVAGGSIVVIGGRGGALSAIDLRMPPGLGWGGRWETRRLWSHAEGHAGGVRCAIALCSGALIASCGRDGAVRLWDAATGELSREWAGVHERKSGVLGALASVGGGGAEAAVGLAEAPHLGLLSCGADGTVKLLGTRQHLEE